MQLLLLLAFDLNCFPMFSVEKAAMVFSLKLDNGHKLLCPWIDNACDERLAEFPPTPPPVLVDKFRERSSALLQLLGLPMISSSALEYMKSSQLEEFLRQAPTLDCGNGSIKISQVEYPGNESEAYSANLYYQVGSFVFVCNYCTYFFLIISVLIQYVDFTVYNLT